MDSVKRFGNSFFNNFNLIVTDGGKFHCKIGTDWSYRTHVAPQHKFYFITDGTCSITINKKEYLAKKGDWFFIPAGTEHSYHNFFDKEFKKFWIHFELTPKNQLFSKGEIDGMVNVKNSKITALFREFATKFSSNTPCDLISVKATVLKLLAIYLELNKMHSEFTLFNENSEINMAIQYVYENLKNPISNKTLAEICHLHPTHFIRFFKSKTGTTPQNFIKYARMEKAKKYLIETDKSITEIAESLGYEDSMYFSKCYKKQFSLSPSAYRKIYKVK